MKGTDSIEKSMPRIFYLTWRLLGCPLEQISLTGNRIALKLYIACGISGAIQHLVGCKGAKNILVINNDKDALFFFQADYGVIGDLHEVVPAIIEEIKSSR